MMSNIYSVNNRPGNPPGTFLWFVVLTDPESEEGWPVLQASLLRL